MFQRNHGVHLGGGF